MGTETALSLLGKVLLALSISPVAWWLIAFISLLLVVGFLLLLVPRKPPGSQERIEPSALEAMPEGATQRSRAGPGYLYRKHLARVQATAPALQGPLVVPAQDREQFLTEEPARRNDEVSLDSPAPPAWSGQNTLPRLPAVTGTGTDLPVASPSPSLQHPAPAPPVEVQAPSDPSFTPALREPAPPQLSATPDQANDEPHGSALAEAYSPRPAVQPIIVPSLPSAWIDEPGEGETPQPHLAPSPKAQDAPLVIVPSAAFLGEQKDDVPSPSAVLPPPSVSSAPVAPFSVDWSPTQPAETPPVAATVAPAPPSSAGQASDQEDEVEAPAAPAAKEALQAPPLALPASTSVPLYVQGFGIAQLFINGESLPQRTTGRELELALYLAHHAALQVGKRATYLNRDVIADAIWWDMAERQDQLNSLASCLSKLNRHVKQSTVSLPTRSWAEQAKNHDLRLHPAIKTDLAEFLTLTRRLAEARTHPAPGTGEVADVQRRLEDLEHLYQSGFATQFQKPEWAWKARNMYRHTYLDARVDAAHVLASCGALRQAIALLSELVLEEEARTEELLPLLFSWLWKVGRVEVERFCQEYPRRYRHKFGVELHIAQPGLEDVRQRELAKL